LPARRFEFEEGSSSKFWAIERDARTVTVTFGRIGSKGQEKAKSFASEEAAAGEEAKLIAEKLRKGYREATGGQTAKAAAPAKKQTSPGPASARGTKRDEPPSVGRDLFFTDPFALTRVAADGGVRSVSKFSGRWLSVDAESRLGLVAKSDGVRLIVDLAKLTEVAAVNYGTALHPTGTAVVTLGVADDVSFDVAKLKGRAPGKPVTRTLAVDATRASAPIRLGEEPGPHLGCEQRLVFDADGSFLAFVADYWVTGDGPREPPVLVAGRFPDPGGKPKIDWRRPLSGPTGGTVALSIADGIGAVFVRDVAAEAVDVVLLGEGTPRVRRIGSVTLPVRVGQTIVYQPDPATVVREPLGGGEVTRHALPAAHAGRGRVVTNGSRWLYLPRFGEVALDLERGAKIARELPPAEAKARAAAITMLRKYEGFATSAKMDIEIAKLDLKYNETRFWVSPGRPGLADAAMWGLGHRVGNEERQSFGHDGSLNPVDRPLTGAQIVEILRFFADQKLPLDTASMFWNQVHARSPNYHLDSEKERALADRDGAAILVRALLDAVSPLPGAYEAKLAKWAKGDLSAEEMTARLQQMKDTEQLKDGRANLEPASWLLFNRFGRDVLRIWFAVPPDQLAHMEVAKPIKRLAETDPKARKQIVAWFGGFDHAGIEWSDVLFELREEFPDKDAPDDDKADASDDEEDDGEPKPPPRGFNKPTTWEAIAQAWGTAPPKRKKKTAAAPDLEEIAKTLGISRLPPSYLAYIERFGSFGELNLRYEREEKYHFPNYLNIFPPDRLKKSHEDFISVLDHFADTSVEMRKRAKDLRGLLPFGYDTSRTDICWDPSKTASDGEMAICFYNHEYDRRVELGRDLKEIVKYFKPGS